MVIVMPAVNSATTSSTAAQIATFVQFTIPTFDSTRFLHAGGLQPIIALKFDPLADDAGGRGKICRDYGLPPTW